MNHVLILQTLLVICTNNRLVLYRTAYKVIFLSIRNVHRKVMQGRTTRDCARTSSCVKKKS